MHLNLIYARAKNGVIGSNGTMPWHLPEDLAHFKKLTMGCTVLMGRKTWESLPPAFRPLPGRVNVVVTRQSNWQAKGAQIAHSLTQALSICKQIGIQTNTQNKPVWVMGGAQIYQEALPFAQRAYVTEIDAEYAGDAYAPVLSEQEWQEQEREKHVNAAGLSYSFVMYQRREN